MGEGIIIFALWYIVIAYNYYIENCSNDEKNSDSQSKASQIPDFIMKQLSVHETNDDNVPVTEEIVTVGGTKEPEKPAETVEPVIDNNEDTADEFIHEEIDEN
ncbi:uncharacterized protein LOC126770651 [Nymphalis io]|uniref:uncharacterized protein LOC126770651 n=1 Tax=Inachis io TaxID=171585 RepID=UPI002169B003|nr:uncharacterized protein LOC126770651 [Nymphalis io]XP_050346127.1 uncharacterized protein LOC126770651 [Nymphalis io]